MSKKSENNIYCVYLYMDRCGPCAQTTPIIDTMIACGTPISKVDHIQSPMVMKRHGTPSIIFYNSEKDEIIGEVLGPNHIQGFKAIKSLGFDVPDFPNYLLNKIQEYNITNTMGK